MATSTGESHPSDEYLVHGRGIADSAHYSEFLCWECCDGVVTELSASGIRLSNSTTIAGWAWSWSRGIPTSRRRGHVRPWRLQLHDANNPWNVRCVHRPPRLFHEFVHVVQGAQLRDLQAAVWLRYSPLRLPVG